MFYGKRLNIRVWKKTRIFILFFLKFKSISTSFQLFRMLFSKTNNFQGTTTITSNHSQRQRH